MKIWKWIFYSGLAVFLCGVLTVAFLFVFYDGAIVLENPRYIEIYEAAKTGAQAVVISQQGFHGDTDYNVGVRASKSEKWRQYSSSFIDQPKKPSWCREPMESRELGHWRWQDANIKKLLYNWKD
ncbi:MAG TPA: hypothetical protein VGB45_01755 [Abditibacterium sp.]|jgi:hypothetical protein